MLNKFFAKPVEIKIGEQELKFSSLADFEFSLAGRTSVPSKKITNMVEFSADELKKEAKTIKEIEKQFASILSNSIEHPQSINRALREIDAQIFSQDHGWRSIIAALHSGDKELNEFRRVALVKYMQYLSSRQEIIKHLYSEKKKHVKAGTASNGVSTASELKHTPSPENTLFRPLSENKTNNEMDRMPKGENVTIRTKAGKEINILLSTHLCKIIGSESGSKFIDGSGRSYDLNIGKNLIGRDSKTDIMLDPGLRDISRTHLIIETDDSNTLYLTDLSAHGTYIPARYLQSNTL